MSCFKTALTLVVLASAAILTSTPAHALSAQQVAKLQPAELLPEDLFGRDVAVDGDTIVVGAPGDDENGDRSGAAYVFVFQAGEWVQQTKLLAPDGEALDQFGERVAISGDTLLVGARGADEAGHDTGAAYVFVRESGAWVVQAKLTAPTPIPDQWFGRVAVDGDIAAIGAPGGGGTYDDSPGVYMFEREGDSWNFVQLLEEGEPTSYLGGSVALQGDQVVTGAERDFVNGPGSGSAYIFARGDGNWIRRAYIYPEDGFGADRFGRDVDIDGDIVLSTSPNHRLDQGGAGAAYIFTREARGWTETAMLTAFDAADGDSFGTSGALEGEVVLIGASEVDDLGVDSGAAYLIAKVDGEWFSQDKIYAAGGAAGDRFGRSIDLDGTIAVIGATGSDDFAGAAYVFRLTGPPVPATGRLGFLLLALIILGAGSYLVLRRRPGNVSRI